MVKTPKVCILAAGSGTRMGNHTKYLHKALLPINKKAAITHIVEKFPTETEFVIALGDRGEQIRSYLRLAHPGRAFNFVEVANHSGKGSGPGLSLFECRKLLNEPFYFVSCDSLWEGALDSFNKSSWIGVARVPEIESSHFCNVRVAGTQVISIHDKVSMSGSDWFAFTGIAFFQSPKKLWQSFDERKYDLVNGELQVSQGLASLVSDASLSFRELSWADIGTKEKYERQIKKYDPYDFSKNEEALFIVGNRVIKFFADASVARNRVERIAVKPKLFPRIVDSVEHFYAYEFVEGATLYEEADESMLKTVLEWLSMELWQPISVDQNAFSESCHEFYKGKTLSRVNSYFRKVGVSDKENVVNGQPLPSTKSLLEKVPWVELEKGTPVFFHGDLHFDHILQEKKSGRYLLIDWRQDFGGQTLAGDIYYDLAKFLGGLILNYSEIKANRMTYSEKPNGEINFDVPKFEKSEQFKKIFFQFLRQKGYDERKVQILTGLIFLNMSPLHNPPFDGLLHNLGKILLSEAVANTRKSQSNISLKRDQST